MTILWCSKHSHDRCKLRTKTILNANHHVWTRQQKRDGIIEHVKDRTLAFKNCNVTCRFSIADFRTLKKIYYLEETLIFRSTFSEIFISKMKILEANRPAWHFSIRIATAKTASELFIYFNSILSWLKPKWRDSVIAKTHYLQWILVKLTMLQVGLFVMWGTLDLSPGAWKMAL